MDFQKAIVNLQLLEAIAKKDLSQIAELLDQGADVNHKNLLDKNNTPLHYAADCPEINKLLVARDANSAAVNDAGLTPLELAQHSPKSAKAFRVVEGRSPVLTYFKRPGTASILGQWYESKLLALVLFRALHWDRIAEFYLATNVDDAGAFDDLVVRYRTVGGVDRLVFLQAKHKPGKGLNLKDVLENVGDKGDFSLGKYFRSFLDIKLRCYEGNQSAIFGDIGENTVVEFIIFTTLKLECTIPKQFDLISRGSENEEDSLFYTCPTGRCIRLEGLLNSLMTVASKWYKEMLVAILAQNSIASNEPVDLTNCVELFLTSVESDENSFKFLQHCYEKISSLKPCDDQKKLKDVKAKIVKLLESEKFKPFKMSDEDCINLPQEFFNKLQFHTEQSTEAEVEQLVKNEIPDHCQTTGDLNLIFQMYHLGVQQWWLQTGAVPFQTKSSALFREAKTAIEKGSLLENLHLISMGKLQVYKQELCPEKLGEALTKEVQRFVNDRDSHTLPIVGGLIESSAARLVEYLRSKDEDQVSFKFVNTDMANLEDKVGQLTSDGGVNDFLVFAHKGQIEQKVVDSLSRNFRKVFLVTDKEMAPANVISEQVNEACCLREIPQEDVGNLPVEDDQDSYRNRRKAFLRNSRRSFRGLLATMGEQLIDLNVNRK
ncbi:uncharacterized protein LOC128093080 [Culex pipiens pallens]|uniref:uncharacterized protein LOC128093080 n=1 Tax=Culex pipiens pallens TaxID=42434 RepID=UPI0022AA1BC1|nr:uncharacterized protein LOC128093080 [Culex pipiens pallens]